MIETLSIVYDNLPQHATDKSVCWVIEAICRFVCICQHVIPKLNPAFNGGGVRLSLSVSG